MGVSSLVTDECTGKNLDVSEKGNTQVEKFNQFVKKIASIYSKVLGSLGFIEGSVPHLNLLVNLLVHLRHCSELNDAVDLCTKRAEDYKNKLRVLSRKLVAKRVQENTTPQGDNLDLLILSYDDLARHLEIPADCIAFMDYKAGFISGLIEELRKAYRIAEYPPNHFADKETKLETIKLDLTRGIAFMYSNATVTDF